MRIRRLWKIAAGLAGAVAAAAVAPRPVPLIAAAALVAATDPLHEALHAIIGRGRLTWASTGPRVVFDGVLSKARYLAALLAPQAITAALAAVSPPAAVLHLASSFTDLAVAAWVARSPSRLFRDEGDAVVGDRGDRVVVEA